MKAACLLATIALVPMLSATVGLRAAQLPASIGDRAVTDATLELAAFDDPATGRKHARKSHGAGSKVPQATTPDLHGATSEDADKQYRKKYGF